MKVHFSEKLPFLETNVWEKTFYSKLTTKDRETNGGTCWMKRGDVSKNDAFDINDGSNVCGIMDVNWNGNNWALACDFRGGDFANA
jgi:hypothetical protein